MPTGIYIRTEKHLVSLRENARKGGQSGKGRVMAPETRAKTFC